MQSIKALPVYMFSFAQAWTSAAPLLQTNQQVFIRAPVQKAQQHMMHMNFTWPGVTTAAQHCPLSLRGDTARLPPNNAIHNNQLPAHPGGKKSLCAHPPDILLQSDRIHNPCLCLWGNVSELSVAVCVQKYSGGRLHKTFQMCAQEKERSARYVRKIDRQ